MKCCKCHAKLPLSFGLKGTGKCNCCGVCQETTMVSNASAVLLIILALTSIPVGWFWKLLLVILISAAFILFARTNVVREGNNGE